MYVCGLMLIIYLLLCKWCLASVSLALDLFYFIWLFGELIHESYFSRSLHKLSPSLGGMEYGRDKNFETQTQPINLIPRKRSTCEIYSLSHQSSGPAIIPFFLLFFLPSTHPSVHPSIHPVIHTSTHLSSDVV